MPSSQGYFLNIVGFLSFLNVLEDRVYPAFSKTDSTYADGRSDIKWHTWLGQSFFDHALMTSWILRVGESGNDIGPGILETGYVLHLGILEEFQKLSYSRQVSLKNRVLWVEQLLYL